MQVLAAAWTAAKAAASVVAGFAAQGPMQAFIVNMAGSAVLSAAASALMRPGLPTRAPGEWVTDPDGGIPFAIGEEIGCAGHQIYKNTYGKDEEYKGIVTVLSGAGPITEYLGFTADRETVTFDGGGEAIGRYDGEMWMRARLGTQPDTALSFPTFGPYSMPSWGENHKLSGKACYGWTLHLDSKYKVYPRGEPDPVWRIKGIKGYDHRLDSTFPGGSGSVRLNDPLTWPTITNPIIADLNWVLGLKENGKVVGGLGISPAGIDWAAYTAAANVADANAWKVTAYPDSKQSKAEVRAAFLQAGGAVIARRAGLVGVVSRGAAKTPVMTITGADLAGDVEMDTASNVLDRLNTITPRYLSKAHEWRHVPAAPVSAEAYVEEDRGRVRSDARDYHYVSSATQAAQLAALDIAHSREGIAGRLILKPYCRALRPGDAFVIDEPELKLAAQKCLVLTREYEPSTDTVSITWCSETDGKYSWAMGQSPGPPPTPSLSDPYLTVSAPGAGSWAVAPDLVLADGAFIPAIQVTGAVDNAQADQVAIAVRLDGATDWTPVVTLEPTATRYVITGLETQEDYEVAVSYRAEGRSSDPLILGPVSVGDKTPPGPVTDHSVTGALGGIDIKWTNPTDADFALVRLYRHTSDSVGSATYLGEIRGTAWRDVPPIMATAYWYWAATVDRSGNEGSKTTLGSASATAFGDLVTRDGLDWDEIGERPDVLTDGRIEAAIAPDGTLTSGAKSGSDLVTRAGGGGVFTGDLNAEANPADLAALDSAAASKLAGIQSGAQMNPANLAALDSTAASDLAAAKNATDSLGALAVKNAVGTADIVSDSVVALQTEPFSGTVTTSGAVSEFSFVTVMEFDVTTNGEPIMIQPNMMAKFWHPAAGDFSFTLRFIRVGFGAIRPDLVVTAINGDQFHGYLSPTFVTKPPAGTHTIQIRAWASTDSGFTHRDFSDRIVTVTRLPTTTI